jgi:hypothetical protein
MITETPQLIGCGVSVIMKNPFDYDATARRRGVAVRALSSRAPTATEANGTDLYTVKLHSALLAVIRI